MIFELKNASGDTLLNMNVPTEKEFFKAILTFATMTENKPVKNLKKYIQDNNLKIIRHNPYTGTKQTYLFK
jgi:hypothetical protein